MNSLVTITVLNTNFNEVDTCSLVALLFLIQKLEKLRIKFLIMLNILLLQNLIS